MATNIIQEVKQIMQKKESGSTEDALKLEHPEFVETYPKLFLSIMEDGFDISMLEFMLSCKSKLNNENANDIDKLVMDKLQHVYIDSVVDPCSRI